MCFKRPVRLIAPDVASHHEQAHPAAGLRLTPLGKRIPEPGELQGFKIDKRFKAEVEVPDLYGAEQRGFGRIMRPWTDHQLLYFRTASVRPFLLSPS